MTPPEPARIEHGPANVYLNGDHVGVTTSPLTITEIIEDDDQGILDIFDDPIEGDPVVAEQMHDDEDYGPFIGPMPNPDAEPAYVHSPDAPAWHNDPRPVMEEHDVHEAVFLHIIEEGGGPLEWNNLVELMREDDPEWGPNFRGANFYNKRFTDLDLTRAKLVGANLDEARFTRCDLNDANLGGASMYRSRLDYCDVTGANYKDAISWDSATWYEVTGYTPPLRDITEEVACFYLLEAIGQRDSAVNENLDAVREQGVRAEWRGHKLHFWFAHEVEKCASPCSTGDCYCEVEHACHGECTCCPCYDGRCDCEPDHDYENFEPTGETFLSTVIGKLEYVWDDSRGLIGKLNMDHRSLHPHISTDGALCLGNAEMPRSIRAADYLIMLLGWAGQHNPASEYRDIEDLPEL